MILVFILPAGFNDEAPQVVGGDLVTVSAVVTEEIHQIPYATYYPLYGTRAAPGGLSVDTVGLQPFFHGNHIAILIL